MTPALLAAVPAIVSADHISIEAPIAAGEGNVRIDLDGQHAEAAAFTLDLDTGDLTLTDGRWIRDDGTLSFQHAALDLGDLSGVLVEARFDGERFIASGDTLTLVDEDTLRGADLTVTVCGCAVPTWDVTARRVTVELDEVARFTGGWIRVCERPIVPVPLGMVPLAERRTGFLVPDLGYNQDGVIAAAPVFFVLGDSADLTVAPEWRQARGLRGIAEGRYALLPGQGGTASVALGPDAQTETLRWAGSWQHGWQPGILRTAVDARLQSDDAYLADYGATFLSRATPFMESRALVAAGPVRLDTDLFQTGAETTQRLVGAAAVGTVPVGPLAVTPHLQMDVFATGADPWDVSAPTPRVRSGARLDAGLQRSALRLQLRGDTEGVSWAGASPWAWGQLEGQARVPLWGDVGPWRHLAEVGVTTLLGGSTGAAEVRSPDEVLPVPWGVGPVVTSRWLAAGGVPISATARVPWTPDGWLPLGTLRAQAGQWSSRVQLESVLQHAELGWGGEGVQLSAAASRGDDILQAGGRAAVRWRSVTVGWRHLQDIEGARMLSTGPELRYVSPCDCLDVTARAAWSVDRAAPDVSLQVRVP